MSERTRKPRLLVLTTTFPRWTGDHEPPFVFELCRRLTDYEVHVIAPHARDAADNEIMDGVHVHRFRYAPERLETLAYAGGIAANLKKSRWKMLLVQGFLLGMLFRAVQIARRHDIHLIHAHWLVPTGLIGATLKTLLPGDNRLLLTAHGGDVLGLRGGLFRALRRWVVGEADTVSVVSSSLVATGRAEGWPNADQMEIAPMGVDLQQTFVPAEGPAQSNGVVFTGRLVEKKGVSHLIEAMPSVVSALPDTSLEIAGDGPLRDALLARVQELGLQSHVRFSGRYAIQALPQILQQAKLAVLPFQVAADGDAEGLGLTIVEAMGCGIPVIAGDVPAVRDIIEHDFNGLLIDPADHARLADTIAQMLNDSARCDRLSAEARRHVLERFDWGTAARRYRQMLSAIAGRSTDV